jgi:hypothetical protein
MNLALAILIVVAATGAAIAAMLWVRHTAPDGSYFHDGDRAAGALGVLTPAERRVNLPCDARANAL